MKEEKNSLEQKGESFLLFPKPYVIAFSKSGCLSEIQIVKT
jgi:hypothetical protein